jgi:hypothetical protein
LPSRSTIPLLLGQAFTHEYGYVTTRLAGYWANRRLTLFKTRDGSHIGRNEKWLKVSKGRQGGKKEGRGKTTSFLSLVVIPLT